MDELGPIGAVDIEDDICRVDVRSIFKEGEVTSETLFKCLLDLNQEGTIHLYDPDDHTGPDGRVCFTMYHVLKDIFSDERVKGGGDDGDNAVDEEKNLNLLKDQLMIEAGADGVIAAGAGGQNTVTGAVVGNNQGDEIGDADTDPGAGDVISDAGAVPGAGDATGDADTKPVMGVMVGDVDKEPMQVHEISKLTVARNVSITPSVGSLSLIRHWASLTLLARKQAHLLHSINSRASLVTALQPSAGSGDDEEFGKLLRILRGGSVGEADYGGRFLNLLPAPENNVADSVHLPSPPIQPVNLNTVPAPRRRTSRSWSACRPTQLSRQPCTRRAGSKGGSAISIHSSSCFRGKGIGSGSEASGGRSDSTIGGERGSGGRYRLKLPPSMLRHLNCIKTVEMYKRSGGLFSLKPRMNRRRHLRFPCRLGCGDCLAAAIHGCTNDVGGNSEGVSGNAEFGTRGGDVVDGSNGSSGGGG
jgi:hypothetical protein